MLTQTGQWLVTFCLSLVQVPLAAHVQTALPTWGLTSAVQGAAAKGGLDRCWLLGLALHNELVALHETLADEFLKDLLGCHQQAFLVPPEKERGQGSSLAGTGDPPHPLLPLPQISLHQKRPGIRGAGARELGTQSFSHRPCSRPGHLSCSAPTSSGNQEEGELPACTAWTCLYR